MSHKEKWKWVYRIVRSVLFTAIAFVAFLYVTLYVLLSIPGVQNRVRMIAEDELSRLFTSSLTIDKVTIYPFNEVVVEGATLKEPDGVTDCAKIERLGAGVSLWRLLVHREIVITYVELIGLDARLRQDAKGGPLNIQFLIDAFKPKDKNKPPTSFDLEIRNIVIRKSKASFSRPWIDEADTKFPQLPMLTVAHLNADVTIPRLSNDIMIFDLRRLEFEAETLVKVENISGCAKLDHGNLSLTDINIETAMSKLVVSDVTLPLKYPGGLKKWLAKENIDIKIYGSRIMPSEFSFLWAPLSRLSSPMALNVDLTGNLHSINLRALDITTPDANSNSDGHFSLKISGTADISDEGGKLQPEAIGLDKFELHSTPAFNAMVVKMLKVESGQSDTRPEEIIAEIGKVGIDLYGKFSRDLRSGNMEAAADLRVNSAIGDMDLKGEWLHSGSLQKFNFSLGSPGIDFGKLLAMDILGHTEIDLKAEAILDNNLFKSLKGKTPEQIIGMVKSADVQLDMPRAVIKKYTLNNTRLNLRKSGEGLTAHLDCGDDNFNIDLEADLLSAGYNSEINLNGRILNLRPAVIDGMMDGIMDMAYEYGSSIKNDYQLSADIDVSLKGNNLDNLRGNINLSDIDIQNLRNGKELNLNNLEMVSDIVGDVNPERSYILSSDWIEGGLTGHFVPSKIPRVIHGMLAEAFPKFILPPKHWEKGENIGDFTFDFTIARTEKILSAGNEIAASSWADFFNIPVNLLYEAEVSGRFGGEEKLLHATVEAPYIQQGRDKLIRGSRISATLCDGTGNVNFGVVYPTKKGDLEVVGDVSAVDGSVLASLNFNPKQNTSFYGKLDLEATMVAPTGHFNSNLEGNDIRLKIFPSTLYLNHAAWNVAEADLTYSKTEAGPVAEIKGFSVSHNDQFVTIGGKASASADDEIVALLNDVDLDYIFDTLNINYVKFGGTATGKAVGSALFSKQIQAETRGLHVKDLSYNGAVLGDGELHGDFDIQRERIGIRADIAENNRHVATVDGGIWLGRDSLSFGIDAEKVRIGFLAPFMEAFASKVEGRASGKAQLYGTFSDIDMSGRLFADTIALGVAYTNVTYCGSDSVVIRPGRIDIPAFTLKDVYGNTATLSGNLTHRYFHDPEFDFRISNAKNLLLYDTNSKMNPVWYGHIFGTGGGRILGRGNYVGISADMTTNANSTFTFVLSDQEEAAEYNFLTFTDRRKAQREAEQPAVVSDTDMIVEAFKKKVLAQQGPESVFGMDIRATLTPDITMTLIMDPIAGDKIVAKGAGAMNMEYRSDTDDLRMYGKYVLDEGVYNFSLQDVILKDFIIKQGSSISFNGDPMAGILDIRAAYRVNTNLADLDQSFAMDRDLNRTQVPVDAMLIVKGDMDSPDISFDIELPTLNDEVAQKVRSVISSDDMMNLQMIYLLALNRFYTPEYMGGSSGGEWASVASSTISSQLSNILGQLTDKFSVAPSIRSDKGDFSDVEVDVALSSRLFNNRLLINGNLGYRDPSTSSTTFIGDFDVEYLLNRAGNWRLKAYNHFNDQNYYLKSALTTQGVGIMWRRDFDHIFGIGRNRKKDDAPADSVAVPISE